MIMKYDDGGSVEHIWKLEMNKRIIFFLYYVLPDNDGNDDDNNGKVSSPIRKFNLTVYLNE